METINDKFHHQAKCEWRTQADDSEGVSSSGGTYKKGRGNGEGERGNEKIVRIKWLKEN